MSEQIIEGHRIGVLFSESQIADRITELAREIAARKPERLLVVPVLKGSFIFAADLIRAMHHAGLSPEVDFMMLSSYRAATRSSDCLICPRVARTASPWSMSGRLSRTAP